MEIASRRRLPESSTRFLRNGAETLRYVRISLIRHRFELESPRGEGGTQYRHRVQMAHGPWLPPAGAETHNPSMLPGFRFLLAAILLSASVLVFGLGAASLLRASHEQYVSNPSWRNGPQEQVFAQASEPAQPVLAALRVEPVAPVANEATPAMQEQVPDNQVPSIGLPAVETAPEQMAAVTLEAKVDSSPSLSLRSSPSRRPQRRLRPPPKRQPLSRPRSRLRLPRPPTHSPSPTRRRPSPPRRRPQRRAPPTCREPQHRRWLRA